MVTGASTADAARAAGRRDQAACCRKRGGTSDRAPARHPARDRLRQQDGPRGLRARRLRAGARRARVLRRAAALRFPARHSRDPRCAATWSSSAASGSTGTAVRRCSRGWRACPEAPTAPSPARCASRCSSCRRRAPASRAATWDASSPAMCSPAPRSSPCPALAPPACAGSSSTAPSATSRSPATRSRWCSPTSSTSRAATS